MLGRFVSLSSSQQSCSVRPESKGFYFHGFLSQWKLGRYLDGDWTIQFSGLGQVMQKHFYPFHSAVLRQHAQPLRAVPQVQFRSTSLWSGFLPGSIFSSPASVPVDLMSTEGMWVRGAGMKHAKLLERLSRWNTIKQCSGPSGT